MGSRCVLVANEAPLPSPSWAWWSRPGLLVVRYAARGVERQQLPWVVFAAALVSLTAVGVLAALAVGALVVFEWVLGVCVEVLPLAISAAVLRYRYTASGCCGRRGSADHRRFDEGCANPTSTDMDNLRTDRLGLLLDQLDSARELAHARLEGLTSPASLPAGTPLPARRGSGPLSDEEYLWEPAPGAWSIRRRGEAASPRPFGPGEWQLDNATGDPDPTPVTTIAWRLGHLHSDFAGRWEWTFGERRQPPELLVDFTPLPRWRWSGFGR